MRKTSRPAAVLAPGYGGSATQPLLLRLEKVLSEQSVLCSRITFGRARPSKDYLRELEILRRARDEANRQTTGPLLLMGRSFGGRMCAFLSAVEPPDALVILGHPVSPPGRPRPLDEEALGRLTCPTLIVQGSQDELGPLRVLRKWARRNPKIELAVLRGAGHELGSKTPAALDAVRDFVERQLASRA